jgi:Ca2+-transporting ATPase
MFCANPCFCYWYPPDNSKSIGHSITPPGGDDQPYVYSGSLIVQGRGLAQVLATCPRSEIGEIGKALYEVKTEISPLQNEINRLVRCLAIIGTAPSLLWVLIYSLSNND